MKKILLYGGLGLIVILIVVSGFLYYELGIKSYHLTDQKVKRIVSTNFDIKPPTLTNNTSQDNATNSSNNTKPKQANGTSTDTKSRQQSNATPSQNNQTTSSKTTKSSVSSSNTTKSNTKNTENNSGTLSSPTTNSNTTNDIHSKSDTSTTKSPSTTSDSNAKTTTNKPTANQVITAYQPSFTQLETQAKSRLDQLLQSAYSEYKKKKANGQKISYLYFLQKYKSSADTLQEKVNQNFNQLYTSLQSTLKTDGYAPTLAQPIKDEYNKQKSMMKQRILNKAVSIISG